MSKPMIPNYPLSETDQTKLFCAGYVLVKAMVDEKKVTIVDPTGSTISYNFPSKRAVSSFVAEAALTRGTIVNDPHGSLHKTSKTRLLADGYTFIRLHVQDRSIKAKTLQKDWHKLMDIPEGKDLISEFIKVLNNSKTLQL